MIRSQRHERCFSQSGSSFPLLLIRIPSLRTAVKDANIYYKSAASGNFGHLFLHSQPLMCFPHTLEVLQVLLRQEELLMSLDKHLLISRSDSLL